MTIILIFAIIALICGILSFVPNFGVLLNISVILLTVVLILTLSGIGRASIQIIYTNENIPTIRNI